MRTARVELEQGLEELRTLLRQHVEQAQQLFRRLIDGRLVMTPGGGLISLVTFVRSRPALPNVSEGSAPREVASAPLSGVWRQSDTFIVGLRLREDTEAFGVTVVKKEGQWVVTKWNWSVA